MKPLRLLLLGPPRIEHNNQTLKVDTRKATALVAYLALSGERPTRDWLAAFLWPDYDERRAKAALRRTLSTLKSAVGAEAVLANREAIGLEAEALWCDVTAFRQALQQEDPGTAVALYRDDFMAGFSLRDSVPFDDWQLQQQESLRRELIQALAQLAQTTTGETAITYARRWSQMDSLSEEAHKQLMKLYVRTGQRTKALTQFRKCVRILDEELGVAPLPETIALYEAIRDKQFDWNHEQISPERVKLTSDALPPATGLLTGMPGSAAPPLVGRTAELSRMSDIYWKIKGDGGLLILEGEVGIGRTRLAETFLDDIQKDGAVVLPARCYEGEANLAYAPVIQLLRYGLQAADAADRLQKVADYHLAAGSWLMPELSQWQTNPLPPVDQEALGAQNRFFEGISEVMAALLKGPQPGVLWVDDAHWLDSASLEFLLFLLRRWQGRPYLILLCLRNDGLSASHPLIRLAAKLRREGVCEQITLTRFTEEEISELINATVPTPPPDLPQRMYQETEGLPFFTVEYLGALVQHQFSPSPDESWDIPLSVRDLLLTRLAQVDQTEKQLLQTAATIEHACNFDELRLISGRSEDETVTALEKLVARGLLVERAAGYDFSHVKLRELAYSEISLARRRLLHRRVAETLSRLYGAQAQTMNITADIATHYQRAGVEEKAARFFVSAGDQARALHAHQEAIHYYESALALGSTEAWRLHEASGDIYVRLGTYSNALTSYETAASLVDGNELGRLEHKIAQVYIRQGAWRQAEAQLSQAHEQLGQNADKAGLYIDRSYVAFNLNELEQAKSYAERGRQLARSPLLVAQSHNVSGILARHEGATDRALDHFAESLSLARTNDLTDIHIASLNNLALAEMTAGQYNTAQEHLKAALSLCVAFGDRHREAALRNNLADLYHQVGDENASMAELKAAVAIYAEIGGQPGNWQPEIWKLTAW